ncbi:hypothetical protein Vadar_015705 [Vaccinium darrowii]|uniref:Uncharacterized protein n=1 Tax=Vaccinium darrowii TaxID=229202 RepID=A0ACB7XZ78_9ERIC|nr:hypothetical protein Vadar_015705 [Vaccinium darrowii]
MLARQTTEMDKGLFMASAQFWSSATNSFHFKVGMMSPTIQEICFITGLRAHGQEANCFLTQTTPLYAYPVSGRSFDECFKYFYSELTSLGKATPLWNVITFPTGYRIQPLSLEAQYRQCTRQLRKEIIRELGYLTPIAEQSVQSSPSGDPKAEVVLDVSTQLDAMVKQGSTDPTDDPLELTLMTF